MWFEEVIAALQLGEIVGQDALATQAIMLGGAGLCFVMTLALAIAAFRAASEARALRAEASAHLAAVRDMTAEMRHLTAQVERTSRQGGGAALQAAPSGIEAVAAPQFAAPRDDGGDERAVGAPAELGAPLGVDGAVEAEMGAAAANAAFDELEGGEEGAGSGAFEPADGPPTENAAVDDVKKRPSRLSRLMRLRR